MSAEDLGEYDELSGTDDDLGSRQLLEIWEEDDSSNDYEPSDHGSSDNEGDASELEQPPMVSIVDAVASLIETNSQVDVGIQADLSTPQDSSSEPTGNGKFLDDTFNLRFEIIGQQLTLKVLLYDWLNKPENAYFEERLKPLCFAAVAGKIHARMPLGGTENILDLPTNGLSADTLQNLQLFDEVCTALGLPRGEVLRIGHEVADYWKMSRPRISTTAIR